MSALASGPCAAVEEKVKSKQQQIELYADIHGLWCPSPGASAKDHPHQLFLVGQCNGDAANQRVSLLNILSKYTLDETSGEVNSLRTHNETVKRSSTKQRVSRSISFSNAFPPGHKTSNREYHVFPRQRVAQFVLEDDRELVNKNETFDETILTICVTRRTPNFAQAQNPGVADADMPDANLSDAQMTIANPIGKVTVPVVGLFPNRAIFPHQKVICQQGGNAAQPQLLTALPGREIRIQFPAADAGGHSTLDDAKLPSRDSLYFHMLFENVETKTRDDSAWKLISFSCKRTGVRWTIVKFDKVDRTRDKRMYHLYRDGMQNWYPPVLSDDDKPKGDPFYRYQPLNFININVVFANVFTNLIAVTRTRSDIFETFYGHDLNADALQTRAARHLYNLIK